MHSDALKALYKPRDALTSVGVQLLRPPLLYRNSVCAAQKQRRPDPLGCLSAASVHSGFNFLSIGQGHSNGHYRQLSLALRKFRPTAAAFFWP